MDHAGGDLRLRNHRRDFIIRDAVPSASRGSLAKPSSSGIHLSRLWTQMWRLGGYRSGRRKVETVRSIVAGLLWVHSASWACRCRRSTGARAGWSGRSSVSGRSSGNPDSAGTVAQVTSVPPVVSRQARQWQFATSMGASSATSYVQRPQWHCPDLHLVSRHSFRGRADPRMQAYRIRRANAIARRSRRCGWGGAVRHRAGPFLPGASAAGLRATRRAKRPAATHGAESPTSIPPC